MRGEAGQGSRPSASLVGMAITSIGLAEEVPPPDPARAVRRSLAHAGLKAGAISVVVVAEALAPTEDTLAAFVRSALGPHGSTVARLATPQDQVIGRSIDGLSSQQGAAIAVLYKDGTTVSLCLVAHATR